MKNDMLSENTNDNKRYEYLDYAKCIGILLIMLGHVTQYFSPMWGLCEYVGSFHVPIFFVVSGCLAWHRKDKTLSLSAYIKKRACTLLIPYLIFSIINSLLKLGVLFVFGGITQSVLKEEAIAFFITGNGTVWFLVTLFFIEVIYAIFSKAWVEHINIILILLGMAGLIVPYLYSWEVNPFGIVFIRVVAGFSFFAIGYFVAKPITKAPVWMLFLIGIVAMIIGLVSCILFGNDYSFFDGSFYNMPISTINAVSGSVGIVLLCRALEMIHIPDKFKKAINYIGKNSLIIMLVHPTILLIFTYPFGDFINSCVGVKGVVVSLVVFIVLVIAEIPFIWIINKYMPWMIGKKKNRSAVVNG